MVTARKRTVLTPSVPRATKAKPAEERRESRALPGRRYRLRPTDESPFGGFDPSRYSDDLVEVQGWAQLDSDAGRNSIIEEHRGATYGPPARPVVTVAQLAADGLARESTTLVRRKDDSTVESTRWEIKPEGQQILLDSMGPND